MNTKFDVGQRVTYPVVHTADGNITGIAISKAGVARYAIGPKWYTEDDLRPTAEDKPVQGNPVTDPVKEGEPVKLYCVKSYKPGEWFTKGKVYETDCKDNFTADDGYQPHGYEWREDYTLGGMPWSYYLVPLVRRPAKAGEWVLIVAVRNPSEHIGYVHNGEIRLIDKAESGIRSTHAAAKKEQRGSWLWEDEYLVLDGYTGDPV